MGKAEQVLSSKITTKGQATIPSAIRRKLGVRPGDSIAFQIKGNSVTITKLDRLDAGFLKLATKAFEDWNTPEAEEAFKDL